MPLVESANDDSLFLISCFVQNLKTLFLLSQKSHIFKSLTQSCLHNPNYSVKCIDNGSQGLALDISKLFSFDAFILKSDELMSKVKS